MADKNETGKQDISLNDVQAMIEKMLADADAKQKKMLAEAEAKAQKIIDDAKASANGEMPAEEVKARKDQEAYMEELVEVKLFKDNGKYKDDVFVGCNGESIAIKRGERVKIKRKFAEVLDNSEHQDYETSKLIESKSDEFAKSGL